jgi:hypothetical protein
MGSRRLGKITLATQLVEKIKMPYHFVSAGAIAASNTVYGWNSNGRQPASKRTGQRRQNFFWSTTKFKKQKTGPKL